MGKRRIRCLHKLGVASESIIGFDQREDRRTEAKDKYGIATFDSFESAVAEQPDVHIISLPPDLHMEYAMRSIDHGLHFFTEASVVDDGVADMMDRTFTIRNKEDEVICQVSKTTKALIQNQVFGSGSESTINIAPGCDCSTILAIVYGIGAVGNHFVADAFNNFVAEPLKESITGSIIESAGLEGVASQYTQASNSATHHAGKLHKTAKFINDNFFK